MSRSPLSPVGKRLRIMSDTEDSEDEDLTSEIYSYKKPFTDQALYIKTKGQNDDSATEKVHSEITSNKEGEQSNSDSSSDEEDVETDNPNEIDWPDGDQEDIDEDEDSSDDEDDDYIDDIVEIDDFEHEGGEAEAIEGDNSSSSSDSSVYPYDAWRQSDRLNMDVAEYANAGIEAFILADSDVDDDDDDDNYEYGIDDCTPDEYLKHDPTPETQYPRPNWTTLHELRRRKHGMLSRRDMRLFEKNTNDSLWMIQRLMITMHLNEHTGSVNCLDFNSTGSLLCSGSDDLSICIWDWQTKSLKKKINTSHTNNVFHSEFCNSDNSIITSSRDGSVRLLDIESGLSELLIMQSGEIGKLAFITPQTLVTCGTNACVNFIDLRAGKPEKLFIVRSPKNNRSCALHTVVSHPLDKHKIVVGGDSPYVFLYDLRRIACNPNEIGPKYCLDNNFENTTNFVTSTAFNSTGDKLLISYNDDDLYVCRTDNWNFIHRYKGHRNEKTIKGCAWFGDDFVLSGSDDGYVYGWDIESEHIVFFQKGNSKGAVNCLSVHPTLPILASSGLDHDVKVWEPSSPDWPQTMKNIKPIICMNTMRRNRDKLRGIQIGVEQDDFDIDTDESDPYL